MKSQILFSRVKKKKIINLSSAEIAQRVVKVLSCHSKTEKTSMNWGKHKHFTAVAIST